MTIKWSKKEAIRHLQELKNPFEVLGQEKPGQPGKLPNLAEKIKELAAKNKGVKLNA